MQYAPTQPYPTVTVGDERGVWVTFGTMSFLLSIEPGHPEHINVTGYAEDARGRAIPMVARLEDDSVQFRVSVSSF